MHISDIIWPFCLFLSSTMLAYASRICIEKCILSRHWFAFSILIFQRIMYIILCSPKYRDTLPYLSETFGLFAQESGLERYCAIGRIHLVHLRIHKYLTDDSSVNFHDKFFLHFLLKFRKKWRKNLSWKFTDESSIKYLWIHKWTRWIRPKNVFFQMSLALFEFIQNCPL